MTAASPGPIALDVDLPPAERSLAALARTRALGLHVLAHMAGVVGRSDAPAHSVLTLDPPVWSHHGVSGSPTEVAVLVDLTLGSAIRSALGPGLRLATISLTVEQVAPAAPGRLTATGRAEWADRDDLEGFGRVEVRDERTHLVAVASGWFVALPAPPGETLPPVPWESEPAAVPDLAPGDLTDHERVVHAALVAGAERADRLDVALLDAVVAPPPGVRAEGDEISYELPTGPELGNRVRQVQGGALYGAAAAAARLVAGSGWQPTVGHAQFLRPVSASALQVRARVLRRGRRALFVDVELAADRPALTARFTLRRSPGDD